MRQTLAPGLEIRLERTHDISAVIHADRSADGRVLITAMPLLYGTYTVTRGTGTFTLSPPLDLNLAAGWPLFKREECGRPKIDTHNCVKTSQLRPGRSFPITPAARFDAIVRIDLRPPAIPRV